MASHAQAWLPSHLDRDLTLAPGEPAQPRDCSQWLNDALTWFHGAMGELAATLAAQDIDPTGPMGGVYESEFFTDDRGRAGPSGTDVGTHNVVPSSARYQR